MIPPEAKGLPQDYVENAKLCCSREAMLRLLPRDAVFAEVGVGLGVFTRQVFDICRPSTFIAIDEFQLHVLPELWGRPTSEVFGGLTHQQAYEERFAAEAKQGKLVVFCGQSAVEIGKLADDSLDVAYIDAGHGYANVRQDLFAVLPKMHPGGFIIANDYVMVPELGMAGPYGVVYAANEFMLDHGWGISHFALQTRMFCDVAMQRNDLLLRRAAEEKSDLAFARDVLESHSWKLTAPLRAASRVMRRIKSIS